MTYTEPPRGTDGSDLGLEALFSASPRRPAGALPCVGRLVRLSLAGGSRELPASAGNECTALSGGRVGARGAAAVRSGATKQAAAQHAWADHIHTSNARLGCGGRGIGHRRAGVR